MYPLSAVLVNCSGSTQTQIRAALAENAVEVGHEFASTNDALAHWPAPPDSVHRMFVVRLASLDDVKQMARLEASFPGWPLMALVEGDCDLPGLFRVSRAGASQILPLPFPREEFDTALDRLLLQFGLRETPCRVVAVSGVAEGAGATSLAVNLAAELAAIGRVPIVLTELSVGMGRLAGQLNLSPAVTTRELLGGAEDPTLGSIQAALLRAGDHLSVLAGQSRTLAPFEWPAGRLTHFFRTLRQQANFVVVDMPYTFDPHYFEALANADRILLIARQDVPAIESAKLLKEAIAERGFPAPDLILNRYDSGRAEFTCTRLGELLRFGSVFPVAADDTGYRAAANNGRPLRDVVPTSPAVYDTRAVAVALLHAAGIPPHVPRRTLWDRARTFLTRMSN